MDYKPDWEQAKMRLEAFWKHTLIDRCCLAVHAPRDGTRLPPFPDLQNGPWLGGLEKFDNSDTASIAHWWTDPDQNYDRAITWFENTYFGGEALPITYVNWGAMSLAAMFGSPAQFKKTSVWYPAVIDDWKDWEWTFDPETNGTWKQIMLIMKRFVEGAAGRYLVGSPELGNGADVLSLLRGMDRLAVDLVQDPDAVHRGVEIISDAWVALMEQVHGLTAQVNAGGGVLAWMGLWAPGRIDQLACDFSAVISPRMFQQFFVPEIIKMGNWCDHGVYHLDGPASMRSTLDILLEIEQIKAIQFTPVAGQPPTISERYIPQYRKILSAGKGLYLLAEPNQVEKILAFLPPEGLFLRTYVASQQEADDLLKCAVHWSSAKHRRP